MGTRSTITARTDDGKVRSIYCHWDGYLAHNGKLLIEHYQTDAAIAALMVLGDLSSLDASPFEPPPEHNFDNSLDGYCSAYGRDRGEKGTEAAEYVSLDEAKADVAGSGADRKEEYQYLWDGIEWWVSSPHGDNGEAWVRLVEAIEMNLDKEAA